MTRHNQLKILLKGNWTAIGLAIAFGILFILIRVPGCQQSVAGIFPDPGLQAAIRKAIGKSTGEIRDTDLVGLTRLVAAYRDISNLEGIQHCTDLRYLALDDNEIIDISALSNLNDLTSLSMSDNQIVDISVLSNLTNLTWLYLNTNRIVDISALSGLINLTTLGLQTNKIVDISVLSGLTNLAMLSISDNEFVDIRTLVDNSGLGEGDSVDIYLNHLDVSPGSSVMRDIETMQDRGVNVGFWPQR